MAIRPDYVTGTLTLVSGSKNFTTTGSALQIAAVQTGDAIITTSGNVLIIASITGQNSGTLFQNCPASAAGSGQALRVRYQPEGSRYQGAIRDLTERLMSGNIEALSGLVGVKDGVIVFTGPGTMRLVPLSDFGPTDAHGNLAELAALTKSNDQLLIMGTNGRLAKKPITDFTGAIDGKLNLDGSQAMTGALRAPHATLTSPSVGYPLLHLRHRQNLITTN